MCFCLWGATADCARGHRYIDFYGTIWTSATFCW